MIEDKIQSTIKPILSLYNKMELEIIEKIAEHFNLNEEFIHSDYWYFEKLKELGGLNNETIKLLEKYTGRTKKELLNAMKNIGINSIPIDQLNIATQKGALSNPEVIINSVNIQNLIKHSYDEIEKSFLQLNKTIEEQVRQTYNDIITEVYIKTNAGICSYQEAILDSLEQLGNKGISILTYQDRNGNIRNYDVIGTVRRDLLIATRGLAGKVNEEVIKQSGNHIVRVTNHFGARTGDGGDNYTNHAWWQEIQFFCWDYDGNATDEEKKLPDFMEHCNYGDVQGIVGINCKHLFTTWYGPIKKDKLDFTYTENEEQYNKTQEQRYLERGVRKWKRKQVIAKKAQDEEGYKKATEKTIEWQDRLNAFAENNNLRREYSREHIKDYKPVSVNKSYEDITRKMLSKAKPYSHNIKINKSFTDNNKIKHPIINKEKLHPVNIESEEYKRAQWLQKMFGGDIRLVPRITEINNSKLKTSTPDFIWNDRKWDLKTITTSGKNVIDNRLKNTKEQSDNFIIDITNNKLNNKEIMKQIDKLYESPYRQWINRIMLIRDEKVIKIYKRK